MGHTSSQISGSIFPTGSLTLTVASGSPIRVQSILLSTGTSAVATEFTITDTDDTTLFVVALVADTSIFMDLDSHFNNGLKIVAQAADASAAVFHTSPGN